MIRPTALVLSLTLAATAATAAPHPQLTTSVAHRLAFYNIRVDPAALTTAQAAALHMLMVSERGYLTVRRKARAILGSPAFRD